MVRALLYLRLTSARNRMTTRAVRLRQPKYLAGALATVAYFYYLIFHRLTPPFPAARGTPARIPSLMGEGILLVFSALLLVVMIGWVAAAWIVPASKPALRFRPAEINFLFPAPVTRRTLVHYSLLNTQLTILLSSLLLGLIWSVRGFSAEAAAMRVAGWWIIISTADMHRSGANLTFATIAERGLSVARAKALAAGIVGLYLTAIAVSLWRAAHFPASADLADGPALARYIAGLLNLGPLHWLLWPFRLLADPFLAPDGRTFLLTLGPALSLVAAHYLWVTRLEVSFAEGSITLVEKRIQLLAARREGLAGPLSRKARPGPFPLSPRGRPEIAFLWKNLISISSTVNWRMLAVASVLLVQAAVIGVQLSTHSHRGHLNVALVVVIIAAIAGFYVLLIGAQLARQDLRNDLGNTDILKTYPLRGWQVLLGELLTPVAILSCLLWILLLAAVSALCFFPKGAGWHSPGVLLTAGFCAACAIPPVCALELLVPNAAMLIFPAWHQATRTRTGGIEMIGQRLIFGLGQFLAIALMLLPAVLAAPVIVFATQWLIGLAPAIILATGAALAIIGAELWIGLWLLGASFEKLDIAAELRP